MDITSLPFPGRPFARLRSGPVADRPPVPEGVGDVWIDVAAGVLYVANQTGDEWLEFSLTITDELEALLGAANVGDLIIGSRDGEEVTWTVISHPGQGKVLVSEDTIGDGPGWTTRDFKFSGLLDVIGSAASGEVPVWTGTAWDAQSLFTDSLADVGATAPNDGDVLVYNDSENEYHPEPLKATSLRDWDGTTPPNNGDVPTWNSSAGKYVPTAPSGGEGGGGAKHMVRVRCNTSPNISNNNSFGTIEWSVEDYDPNDMWEGETNPERITIQKTGVYHISAGIVLETGSISPLYYLELQIVNNDGVILARQSADVTAAINFGQGADFGINVSTDYYFTNGDYITVQARILANSLARNILASQGWTYVAVHEI